MAAILTCISFTDINAKVFSSVAIFDVFRIINSLLM